MVERRSGRRKGETEKGKKLINPKRRVDHPKAIEGMKRRRRGSRRRGRERNPGDPMRERRRRERRNEREIALKKFGKKRRRG